MSDTSNIDFSRSEYTKYVIDNVEKEAVRIAVFGLLDFAIKKAHKIKFGQGQWNFHYIIDTQGTPTMLYSWDTYGVCVYLGNFSWYEKRIRSRFVQSLTKLSDGFNDIKKLLDGKANGSFVIEKTLVDPTIMTAFQEAVLKFQSEVYNSPPLGSFSG
jgi:methyl coenzyme M reductase subunit C-like uncharacterized protein (methanogenesis marker protein 7)